MWRAAGRLWGSLGCSRSAPRLQMAPKRQTRAAAGQPGAGEQPSAAAEQPAKRQKTGKGAASAAAASAAAAAAPPAARQGPAYFLVKSEPDVFSIDDLAAKPDQTEHWDGVRSHQAKKVLQSMRAGDQAFFYHSNAKPPGVVGIVEIVKEAYPDHTQFDAKSEYYDPKSKQESPTWCMVDCRLVRRLARQIPLEELKSHSGPGGALEGMALFKYGRLSVQPVTPAEWEFVLGLEGLEGQHGQQGEAAAAPAGRGKKGRGGGKK